MRRREFLSAAIGAAVVGPGSVARALSNNALSVPNMLLEANSAPTGAGGNTDGLKPMAVGWLIAPARGPEATIARVKELGFSNCFLSLDEYIGKFTPVLAQQMKGLLEKHGITATAVEVVGPGRLVWNFTDGPSTIGLVPRKNRTATIDALKQASDFAKLLGVPRVQTHCGFIPEDPRDPLYEEAVLAIRELAMHCAGNGQSFLMETGQETPTTLWRAIKDVDQPNLGVGLDTANLILYGKANPVDAVDIIGPYVKSVHAKDGKWPTDPMSLGEEVFIGEGLVDFEKVFTKLQKVGYTGAITIERETKGAQQFEDVKQEKAYLERIIAQIQNNHA